MIYQYTGQPGHGKTLHGMLKALEFKDQGRLVYACNIRDLDYEKSGFLPMTPEQFRDWPNFLPDGAVCLVDEIYEHEMLAKRPVGSKVPNHVEQLAKHRHRGIDFIFICQSPKSQMDVFVHDLIEQHTHVRRRFGLPVVHLRIFDRFEPNPTKGHPLIVKRVRLPKRPMGMYKSTEFDTTEKNIPWYYPAALVLVLAIGYGIYYNFNSVNEKFSGEKTVALTGENGATAKVEHGQGVQNSSVENKTETLEQYIDQYTPRIASQPWSAPAYDKLDPPQNPPRIFCMSSGNPSDSCGCITDQGTTYELDLATCRTISFHGQYEPYLDVVQNGEKAAAEVEQRLAISSSNRENSSVPQGGDSVIGSQADPSKIGVDASKVKGWIKSY